MEPRLTRMDEDLSVEIVKPKNETSDLIITVSLTRTYLFSEQSDVYGTNGKSQHSDSHLEEMNAFLL